MAIKSIFQATCVVLALTVSGATAGGTPVLQGQAAAEIQPTQPSSAAVSADKLANEQALEEYKLGVHDLLEISVFQAPELSRTVRINSRGFISIPIIGTVQARGLTAHELEQVLAQRLAKDLLQDPQVSVFIKEFISQRVVIEGKVKKTGVFPITGRTTLLQALALADGLDPLANEKEVKIFRLHPDGRKEMMVFDLTEIRAGRTADPLVKGNDLVVIEEAAGRAAIKSITDTLRGFFSFGML